MNEAELQAAIAAYQQAGGKIKRIPTRERKRPGRSRVIDDDALVQQLRELAPQGVVAAARALHRHTTTINKLAERHGIRFGTRGANRQAKRAERQRLAPEVRRLARQRLSQERIAAELDTSRWVVRRIAVENRININSRR